MKKFTDFFLTGRLLDLALAELGYTLHMSDAIIQPVATAVPDILRATIDHNMQVFDLGNEQAKREAMVGPVLSAAALAHGVARIQTEAPVNSAAVSGTVDYWVTGTHTVLVVEAKDHDIARGLGQLAAELIAAVEQPDVIRPAWGAVTSGDLWRFATINEADKTILAERTAYAIPAQLEAVFQRVCAILG